MLRGLIFDLDGTLVDTNDAHIESWVRAFKQNGFTVRREQIVPLVGMGSDKLAPAILGDVDKLTLDALRQCVTEAYIQIARRRRFRVMPGAVELLVELRRQVIRTALATSGTDDQVNATMDSAGIDFRDCVEVTVTGSDAKSTKPDPDVVLASVQRLRVSADECAMIGDTRHDGEACRRAGVRFLALTCGGYGEDELRAAGAIDVWTDPAALLLDLPRLLER
ncbi:MAG TPA: HAD family hydrolase [Gemmatimonadaceae bacterium]|nr:HAD family hydrolase [Gemmatimonadaceae bacterium]